VAVRNKKSGNKKRGSWLKFIPVEIRYHAIKQLLLKGEQESAR